MNGSEELLMPSAEYVMAFKWIIDGILLPAVGSVGIIGFYCSILISIFILAILCRPLWHCLAKVAHHFQICFRNPLFEMCCFHGHCPNSSCLFHLFNGQYEQQVAQNTLASVLTPSKTRNCPFRSGKKCSKPSRQAFTTPHPLTGIAHGNNTF